MIGELHDDEVEAVEACDAPNTPPREIPDIPFGVTRGLSNEDYHGDRSAVSSTQLKRMLISPAHFLSGISDSEESTEALLFGSVLHGRLLEPDTFVRIPLIADTHSKLIADSVPGDRGHPG